MGVYCDEQMGFFYTLIVKYIFFSRYDLKTIDVRGRTIDASFSLKIGEKQSLCNCDSFHCSK